MRGEKMNTVIAVKALKKRYGNKVADLIFPLVLMLGVAIISGIIAVKKFKWE